MTINQAIRILDPETTAEELATIEYYGGEDGSRLRRGLPHSGSNYEKISGGEQGQ